MLQKPLSGIKTTIGTIFIESRGAATRKANYKNSFRTARSFPPSNHDFFFFISPSLFLFSRKFIIFPRLLGIFAIDYIGPLIVSREVYNNIIMKNERVPMWNDVVLDSPGYGYWNAVGAS